MAQPMPYAPIVATPGYVLSPVRQRVLMIHRNAGPHGLHLGTYNGLSGKLDADEDALAGSVARSARKPGLIARNLPCVAP